MQRIADILTLDRTLFSVPVQSKKKALELVADTISSSIPALRAHLIFDALIARERLGSTAIGHGIAIPHARLEPIDQTIGCFLLLKDSIDFDAQDHIPVDMLFALIVPFETTDEHLALLASLAQIFRQESVRASLRECKNVKDLFQTLISV